MANASVGSMSEWSGVFKDFFRQVDDGSLTLDMLKGFVAHRQVRRFHFADTQDTLYKSHRTKWEDRWKRDLSGLWIPEHQEGFDRLLVMPQGMTTNKAFDRLTAAGIPVWRYTDNLNITFSARLANADYAVWVRDRQEADEEWKEKSANDALAAFVNGITLPERLVFEEDYFLETGNHLDEQNITLCSGSRSPGGNVPVVCWLVDEVLVRWCEARGALGNLRCREVVF